MPLPTNGRGSAHEGRGSAGEPAIKQSSDDVPIACCLTSAELREREATLLAQFRSAVIETEELVDGYAFRVPDDSKSIETVAEMMVAERECCPFLTFELVAQTGMGPVFVRVTGPAGTKNFLKTFSVSPMRRSSGGRRLGRGETSVWDRAPTQGENQLSVGGSWLSS
jgi:hypothetical protein